MPTTLIVQCFGSVTGTGLDSDQDTDHAIYLIADSDQAPDPDQGFATTEKEKNLIFFFY
jgi:hypothetical protein